MEFQKKPGSIYLENEDGTVIAEITYEYIGNNVMSITHTYVDECLRGQGIASKLVEAAVREIKRQGRAVTATCSYAAGWLRKHGTEG